MDKYWIKKLPKMKYLNKGLKAPLDEDKPLLLSLAVYYFALFSIGFINLELLTDNIIIASFITIAYRRSIFTLTYRSHYTKTPNPVTRKLVLNIFITSVILLLIIGSGYLLFIIPGVILTSYFLFTLPLASLYKMNIGDSMKYSYRIASNNRKDVLLLVGSTIILKSSLLLGIINSLLLYLEFKMLSLLFLFLFIILFSTVEIGYNAAVVEFLNNTENQPYER